MTSIVRFDPAREVEQVFNRFNRMFNDSRLFSRFGIGAGDSESLTLADWTPAVDIQETQDAYVVNAELPDVRKEDVHVSVQEGVLMLSGERRQEREEKGTRYHRIERSYGRFERSFTLPESIDEKKINAAYRDGMLHLTLPKMPASKTAGHEIKIS